MPPSFQRETDSARDGVFTARQHWDVASLWSGITPAAGRSPPPHPQLYKRETITNLVNSI
ncbi:hypothetical protein Hanom_Chr11g01060961 [Helianthus anomalus]